MKLLDPNSAIGRMFLRLMDLVILNALWVLTSLPVVTIGAATTAMYDVAMQMALEEDSGVVKPYFRSFFHHFWRATALTAAAAAVGAFIALDLWAALRLEGWLGMASLGLIIASVYLYLAVLSHLFPTLARFDGGVVQTVKDAFRFTIMNGVHGVWIAALNLLPVGLYLLAPEFFIRTSFLWISLGVALTAYFISVRLTKLFDPEKAAQARRREP